jgi:ribose/xylose/arabinose/galactoside ABC-type transport system permease subunit
MTADSRTGDLNRPEAGDGAAATLGPAPGEPAVGASREARLKELTRRTGAVVAREYGVHLALLLLVVIFSFTAPGFATSGNLLLILQQVAVIGMIAVGMTFVILTAGIDLSVGALLAVVSLFSGLWAQKSATPLNVTLAFGLPILAGIGGGLVNGVLIAYARLNPLIVTLGTFTAFYGFAVWFRIDPIYNLQPYYRYIGTENLGPIPYPVVVYVLLAVIGTIVLTRTRFGREVYAVGGNEEAARAAGVNIKRVQLMVYVIAGLCVGIASIVFTARLGAAQSISGQNFNLQAIAAVVIGGTSLFGGRGKLPGTVVGTLIVGVLFNALILLNVSYPVQQMIIGGIIIAAVWLDTVLQRGAR